MWLITILLILAIALFIYAMVAHFKSTDPGQPMANRVVAALSAAITFLLSAAGSYLSGVPSP